MTDVEEIVRRAADLNSAPEARREAFGELVIRFQDMAFACAFAVLRDAYLAQDTAPGSVCRRVEVLLWRSHVSQRLARVSHARPGLGASRSQDSQDCSRLTCESCQIL